VHQARRARIDIRRVSSQLASSKIADRGSNPLGCAVAITALEVLERENLAERSQRLGEIFRAELAKLNSPFIKIIRGRGLFNGVVIDESQSKKGRTAWQLCLLMKSKGLLAKPTHVNMCVVVFGSTGRS
jgi:ornithine--oxo-acid transaminase